MAWVLDLDGVIWLGKKAIPGSTEAVNRLQESGEQVLFVTNNSGRTVKDVEAKLAGFGIEARGGIITSAMAAARLVEPGEKVLGLCGPGMIEALKKRRAIVVQEGFADTVVVGFHDDFDYWRLTAGLQALDKGARLVATNDDVTYPSDDGIRPGAGSILAALVAGSDVIPEVAGKPYEPMCSLIRESVGSEGIVVGDRPDTDGKLARNLEWAFALVLSGVVKKTDLPVNPVPDMVSEDLAGIVESFFK